MDKSGIENPSKSEVIGCFGGDEKPNDNAEQTKGESSKRLKNLRRNVNAWSPFHMLIIFDKVYCKYDLEWEIVQIHFTWLEK